MEEVDVVVTKVVVGATLLVEWEMMVMMVLWEMMNMIKMMTNMKVEMVVDMEFSKHGSKYFLLFSATNKFFQAYSESTTT